MGCASSKQEEQAQQPQDTMPKPASEEKQLNESLAAPAAAAPAAAAGGGKKPVIAIVYYSTYKHVLTLAEEIKKGVEEAGCEAKLYQVQETLSEDILKLLHAPPKADHPIVTPEDLAAADGIIFGLPTRFGSPSAQVRALCDSTGGLWQGGKLVGKPAATFISTACQGGGQETTHFTLLPFFVHHGMLYVPLGYTKGDIQFNMDVVHGGSAYGSSTFAKGDGSRQPSDDEKALAVHHGQHFATTTKALVIGKSL